ncbi:hypothetical protein E2562_034354 [Oryza meyeriana var. granulata]|uniref:Retroviral polymerase SH3-like domain-containing protein n=1 Tax=Oryza meyeriana var. granulata TaxID=110450 RepID=A0A6G1ECC3_9ORYZ|nr:hypothetical protein E2562_034354 [Oryza meyeriana var. granulata]
MRRSEESGKVRLEASRGRAAVAERSAGGRERGSGAGLQECEADAGAKAWSFYDPATRRAVVSRDAVFDESAS